MQITEEAAAGAKAIIAWGNCASAGCVQAANPNPTGANGIHKVIKGTPIINVQGCPPIADVMAGVIIYMLTFERMPQLDGLGLSLIHILHVLRDPTRGGGSGTLNEIAQDAGVDILLDEDALPIPEAVRAASEMLGLDPLYICLLYTSMANGCRLFVALFQGRTVGYSLSGRFRGAHRHGKDRYA